MMVASVWIPAIETQPVPTKPVYIHTSNNQLDRVVELTSHDILY